MNLAISQNRHILSMIGIPVWASRTHAAERVPVMGDRLGQKPMQITDGVMDNHHDNDGDDSDDGYNGYDDHDSYNHDKNFDKHDDVADNVANTSTSHTPNIATNKQVADSPNTLQVATPQTTNPPISVPKPDIRYHLKGVRFGRWVLVVDLQYIDTDVHSVWLSLCEALERQAQTTNLPYRTHEIHYPLVKDDYAEHQGFAPANQACLGFVLGLAMPDVTSVHIGLLTPLTEGLSIKNAYTLTDIRLLAMHSEQKRAFWTFVNQA